VPSRSRAVLWLSFAGCRAPFLLLWQRKGFPLIGVWVVVVGITLGVRGIMLVPLRAVVVRQVELRPLRGPVV
jgi:hypothetical protein